MHVLANFRHEAHDYQIVYLESQERVQLWDNITGRWLLGHGKDVPMGGRAVDVAYDMRDFIVGNIDHGEYNRRLPR